MKNNLGFKLSVLLFIFATLFAGVGLGHDLPVTRNSVEEQSVSYSFRFFINPDFSKPCCIHYPPLYFYTMSFAIKLYEWVGTLTGIFPDHDWFIAKMMINPTGLTLLFRAISAIAFGVLGLAVFAAANSLYGLKSGMVAYLLVLATPSMVDYSTKGQLEMAMVAVSACVVYATVLVNKRGTTTNLTALSFLAALGTSLKYNAAVLLIAPFLSVISGWRRNKLKAFGLCLGGFVFGILLFHPYIPIIMSSRYFIDLFFIDIRLALEKLIPPAFFGYISIIRVGDFAKDVHKNVFVWIIQSFLKNEGLVGWFLFILFIVSVFWLLLRLLVRIPFKLNFKVQAINVSVVIVLVVWVSFLKGFHTEMQYILPLYPFLFISVVPLIERAIQWKKSLWYVLMVLLIIGSTNRFVYQRDLITLSNTQLASTWIKENLKMGEAFVFAPASPLVLNNPYKSFLLDFDSLPSKAQGVVRQLIGPDEIPTEINFRHVASFPDWPKEWNGDQIRESSKELANVRAYSLRYLSLSEMRELKARYFVVTSAEYENVMKNPVFPSGSTLFDLFMREKRAYMSILEHPEVNLVKVLDQGRGSKMLVYEL